ncbi:MAG: alpha/beta hydrolase [Arthrobacter sp.]
MPVHFAEHGTGRPVLALHGAGVDHREVAGALEPIFSTMPKYRRLYPDLPGMGHTPAPGTIKGNDNVLDLLLGFIDHAIGDEHFLVMGHSYGAYLARSIAALRPEQSAGLALICPVGAQAQDVPRHEVLVSRAGLPGRLDPSLEATYRDYFVIQTPETLRKFLERVAASAALVDEAALSRIFSNWELRDRAEAAAPYLHPVLVLAGRQDATAGYRAPQELAGQYPHATVAILDRAGHALLHEQPDLVHALIADWLARVEDR